MNAKFKWLAIGCVTLAPFAVLSLAPLGGKSANAQENPGQLPGETLTCSTAGCLIGMNSCAKAACMVPYSGGATVCEYAAKLTGTCRCLPGDKRSCGGTQN